MGDKPKYKAISYAWGDPVFPRTLQLPGGQLRITESLFGALKRFRSESESVRLWADAVCINQDGILEKNHQVTVMYQIYERAEEVLVWLGENHPSDCLALWTLERLAGLDGGLRHTPTADEIKTHVFELRSNRAGSMRCAQCGSGLKLSRRKKLDAFSYFGRRPWFSRLWVIQEVDSATHYTMVFGKHRIPSATVKRAFWSWDPDVYHQNPGALQDTRSDIFQPLPFYSAMNLMTRKKSQGYSGLLEMIFNTLYADCSNSHDRIFAIRKIAEAHYIDLLMPDYSLPIEDLWKRAAIVELTHPSTWDLGKYTEHSPMCILAIAGVQQRFGVADVPSWVPDFGDLGDECQRKFDTHQQYSRDQCAGGKSRIHAVVTTESNVLSIRGKVLCTINTTCLRSHYRPTFHEASGVGATEDVYIGQLGRNLFSWFVNIIEFISAHMELDPHQQLPLTTLLEHGLILNTSSLGHGAEYDIHQSAFQRWQAIAHPTINSDLELSTMYKALRRYLCLDWDIPNFIDRTRILASTTTGLVGWISEAAEPGDFVTLFEGSPYPVILRRRQDGYYSVIGDAYIQGIMHGEAWPEDGAGVDWIEMK